MTAGPGVCVRCGLLPRVPGQRWCQHCRNRWMRMNRLAYSDLDAEAKFKDIARSYANTYKARGLLQQEPCSVCGNPDTQMHHPDHHYPLDVVWLCRAHHMAEHGKRAWTADGAREISRPRSHSP